jgi:hypothetical protein
MGKETINPLDAILNQYEKNTENRGGNKPKMSNEERLKKYFTEKLKKGEKSAEKTFRILPSSDPTKSPFVEAYYHELSVNSKFEKIHCAKLNDGGDCKICEAKDALYEDGSKKAKLLGSTYTARKFYVVKGIDRDNADHGVKFWRFKHKYTGDGVMDKLIPILKRKGNIMDPRTGRDITISSVRNEKGWSVVTSIMPEDEAVITDPKSAEAKEWIGNSETWRDVYAVKSPEFVTIVAEQKTPVWDSEQKKYVAEEDKDEKETASLEEEINMMGSMGETDSKELEKEVEVTSLETAGGNDDDDDELPF